MNGRIEVTEGQMRDLRVWVVRDEVNLLVLEVDSNTKRPVIGRGSGWNNDAEGLYRFVAMSAGEHTLRAEEDAPPTQIRFIGFDDEWMLECPDTCRYAFHVVLWRTQRDDEKMTLIWPKEQTP